MDSLACSHISLNNNDMSLLNIILLMDGMAALLEGLCLIGCDMPSDLHNSSRRMKISVRHRMRTSVEC